MFVSSRPIVSEPRRRTQPAFLLAILTLIVSGCSSTTRTSDQTDASHVDIPWRDRPVTPRHDVPVHREKIGVSVDGHAIDAVTIGDGRDVTLLIASIHGDEAAGTPLLKHMIVRLQEQPELVRGRTVILIPNVNPDGVSSNTRTNRRGVDLNRNFPASNWRVSRARGPHPLSEPEAQAIATLIEAARPDRIVSIHQPLACVDWDGPAATLAAAMAGESDLPLRKLGARPGSLGSWAGETLGIPTITLELPPSASALATANAWDAYGRMLLGSVSFPDALPAK